MALPTGVREKIEEWLPRLNCQPVCPQLGNRISLEVAERNLSLRVIGFLDHVNVHWIRLVAYMNELGPYFFEIWANDGKPYIRILDTKKNENVDVILL